MKLNFDFVIKMSTATTALTLLLSSPIAVGAQVVHHDSNTLHKIGKSITYPVRKDAANISTTTHRSLGKNSVANKKYGPALRQKTVTTPGGHTKPVAPVTVTGHG